MTGVTIIETETLQTLISQVQDMKDFVAKTAADLKDSKKPYLSVKEVSEITGFGKPWVLANKQKIGFLTVGDEFRFKRADVTEFMETYYFKSKQS